MRIFPKMVISLLPLVILPMVLAVLIVMYRGDASIRNLLKRYVSLELEYFEYQCTQENRILEQLGLKEMDFYRRNAQREIIRYAGTRDISSGYLFIEDGGGRPIFNQNLPTEDVFTLTKKFEPWDWTLGVAVSRSFLNEFTRNTLIGTVLVLAGILLPVILVSLLLARVISRPIAALEKGARRLAAGDLNTRVDIPSQDEIGSLGKTFNTMAANLGELTQNLEEQVKLRTAELERTLGDFREAQDLLIKRERLANLGTVVAGLAHEINTPIGIGVTSSTHMKGLVSEVIKSFEAGTLSSMDFKTFLDDSSQISDMIYTNLKRANDLIANFKLLAVDQISEQRRAFNFSEYIESVIGSMKSRIKNTGIEVHTDIDDDLEIVSYPGVFYQIISNLIINSLVHGFEFRDKGEIRITAERDETMLTILYRDNGSGMEKGIADRIYEPFVSTRTGKGGSGLGMNIVFNLVNRRLNGSIRLETAPGEGVRFRIEIPESELN